ncbi:unnamed protein product [Closterium sp. NIES-53]
MAAADIFEAPQKSAAANMDSSFVAAARLWASTGGVTFRSARRSVDLVHAAGGAPPSANRAAVSSYLHRIQRPGLVQNFGSLLAIPGDGKSFDLVAFSENAGQMILNESPPAPAAASAGAGAADAENAGMGGAGSAAAAMIGRSQTIPEGAELAPTAEAIRRGEEGASAGGAAAGGGERRRLVKMASEGSTLFKPLNFLERIRWAIFRSNSRGRAKGARRTRRLSADAAAHVSSAPAAAGVAGRASNDARAGGGSRASDGWGDAGRAGEMGAERDGGGGGGGGAASVSDSAIFVGRGLEEAAVRTLGEGAPASAQGGEAEDAVAPLPQTKIALGMDVRSLFTPESVEALEKAVAADDIASMNPVLLQCRSSNRPFYAVLHRTSAAADDADTANTSGTSTSTTSGSSSIIPTSVTSTSILSLPGTASPSSPVATLPASIPTAATTTTAPTSIATALTPTTTLNPTAVTTNNPGNNIISIDLEPITALDPAVDGAGAPLTHRLALSAVKRLQKVAPGNISALCQVVVDEVRELTGYDRVVAYKFHEDGHGEVVAEDMRKGRKGRKGGGGGGGKGTGRRSGSGGAGEGEGGEGREEREQHGEHGEEEEEGEEGEEEEGAMEPILGSHFPATDVPQATRLLFFQTRSRMVADCQSPSIPLCQHPLSAPHPLKLGGSTLRAVDPCHVQYMCNMGIRASYVLAIMVPTRGANALGQTGGGGVGGGHGGSQSGGAQFARRGRGGGGGVRLWGLVVCHHMSPRVVPFPVRSACDFLMQAFGLQLSVELEIAAQLHEKQILQIQSLLCDTLLTDNPIRALVSSAPNIMDLLPCDGAAVLFRGELSRLGVCPSEDMIGELVRWLQREHCGSSGLSTDSLKAAGFPFADTLGVDVCGMVVVCFSPADEQQQQQERQQERQQQQGREAASPVPPSPSGSSTSGGGWGGASGSFSSVSGVTGDYLFWFRSHVEKSIKWSGARHNPLDVDDAKRRHPRASFKAFLEVVRHRALPWADVEVDAVHSLQDLLCKSVRRKESMGRLLSMGKQNNSELAVAADELVRLIETASAPILAVDLEGNITGWNGKVAAITGLSFSDAIGQSLLDTCLDPSCVDKTRTAFELALAGEEQQQLELKLKRWGSVPQGKGPPTPYAILHVNTFVSRDSEKSIVGVCFVGQDVTEETAVRTRFVRIQGDFTTIINTHNSLMPPIFATNASGFCTEWNPAMESITGLKRSQVLGCMLPGIIFGRMCQLADDDSLTRLLIMLSRAMAGQDAGGEEKMHFAFRNAKGRMVEVLLTVQQRLGGDGRAAGAFGFLHVASPELMQALAVQQKAEGLIEHHSKQLAYVRQAMAGAVHGMVHARSLLHRSLLDASPLSPSAHAAPSAAAPGGKVWQFMEAMARCDAQLMRLLHTQMDPLGGGEGGGGGADAAVFSHPSMLPFTPSAPFTMASLINTAVCQAMQHAIRRSIDLTYDALPDVASTRLVGNQLLLQQVLGGITVAAVKSTPSGGTVRLQLAPSPSRMLAVEIELRIIQSGPGIDDPIIQHMFGLASCPEDSPEASYQAHALVSYRSLLRQMHGDVHYLRQPNKCYFQVSLELPCAPRA